MAVWPAIKLHSSVSFITQKMEKTTILVFVVFMFEKHTNKQDSIVKSLLNASLVVRNSYLLPD